MSITQTADQDVSQLPLKSLQDKDQPEVESAQHEDQNADVKDIAKGAAVNLLGEIAKSLKPAYLAVVTRLYGAEAFGLYTLAWALIDFTSNLGSFGLDKGLIRFLPRYRNKGDVAGAHRIIASAFVIGVVASLLVTALVYSGASLFAKTIFDKPNLIPVVKILCLAIPFIMVLKIFLAATQAVRIMRFTIYVRSLIEPAIWFAGALVCYSLSLQAAGLAWAHVAAIAGSVLVAGYFFERLFSLRQCARESRNFSSWRPLARFSLPLSLRDPLSILISRLDIFLVAYFLPAAEVGLYAIILEIANVIKKVRQSFIPIFMPVVSDLVQQGKAERLKSSYSFVVRWILGINIAFLAGIALLGKDILAIFGPEFSQAATALIILCVGNTIAGAFDNSEILLLMSGRTYLSLLDLCLLLIVNIALDLFLIPMFGIEGAALGAAISLIVVNVIRLVQVRVLLHVHPFRKSLLKPLFAGATAFSLVFFVLRHFPNHGYLLLIAMTLLFLLSYITLLRLFKREPQDRELEERAWRKTREQIRKIAPWLGIVMRRMRR